MSNGKKGGNGANEVNRLLKGFNLSPEQIAVVTAILFNVLEIQSVLLDRDQRLQILLIGHLGRRPEEEGEEITQQVDGALFETLVSNMIRNS